MKGLNIIMKNFVNYKWLMKNLNNSNLVILDARANQNNHLDGLIAYNKEHIRYASFVSLEDIMTGSKSTHGGRRPLPEINKFVEDMKSLGITEKSSVIIYDDGNLSTSGRLWWLLRYIGKYNVYILEGGIANWKVNNGEITDEIPKVVKSEYLPFKINNSMLVDMKYVKNAINLDNTAIVDARTYERYIGKIDPLDRIAGHIPNALSYPSSDLVKNGKLVSLSKIKNYFKELKKYDEIIAYCGSGIAATLNIILMEEIGLKSKLYLGGYSDWISYRENKVIKSP